MVNFDLKSYTALYLKNAQEEIRLIRDYINQKDVDIKALHRITHTLKGQSFFMGIDDIGNKAWELEKYYKSLLEGNGNPSNKRLDVEVILNEIEKLLANKKI
ncbi:hypothetical protein CO051_04160 [Candidatus Roizmanbacteria bacterium CG_4_9_14_0_2_um_filter_39_13]|uniref:HPt domain-containing protein n=1 Tax=Candidatus Roizmanbacteria bacterium CG_4_9_14_0_2_um_filter_39_13 TaxID=1974839 RepID=A0A2M8EYA0_9BACT|nr:MAG: hypothetical protein CO051_04160 [Candidatus Roizmanbacteria bacterium CG_4_9_14_0_2_um_filter_39_13]